MTSGVMVKIFIRFVELCPSKSSKFAALWASIFEELVRRQVRSNYWGQSGPAPPPNNFHNLILESSAFLISEALGHVA